MTIKKRLFISNIFMIVIPYLISMITMWSSIFVFGLLSSNEPDELSRGIRNILSRQIADNGYHAIIIAVLVLAFMFTVMILTNRFLTKFVFKKINQPLEILSSGVQHISDGDLSYRITYTENNEFKPVCEAFNDMAAQLKASIDEVNKNDQNRKELIAGISHDLRSPLTSIKAFTEGLIDGVAKTPEAQQKYLNTIKQKTEDINNIVSQLFLYSKMDIGNYPTCPEKLDVGKEINEYVTASKEEYDAKGLSLKLVGLTTGVNIYADPLQLRSIFANILDNSAKYKKAETAVSKITCMNIDKNIVIIFEDNGLGVSDEALPHLFEIFYRTDPSRRNPNQGSGLGLAIVRKAIEHMGGKIKAENIKEGGLRIIINIPIMKGEQLS